MKILAISDLHEEFAYLDRLPEVTKNEAVVFTGNILRAEARRMEWERAHAEHRAPSMTRPEVARERDDDAQSINRFLKTLNALGVPVFLVPGRNDAPERFFLQAAFNRKKFCSSTPRPRRNLRTAKQPAATKWSATSSKLMIHNSRCARGAMVRGER